MDLFSRLFDFENLYKAHCKARRGKRDNREVVAFEMNLAEELSELSNEIQNRSYRLSEYYSFTVYDPKKRIIHALHYRDRVVQHCLCDEIIEPVINKRLIYDNAACRKGKGLPLGNQSSQWFALLYLDGVDRLIKERFRIECYSRYMDDMILIHEDKIYLNECMKEIAAFLSEERHMEFNSKTQISPVSSGFDYLGWHFYLADTGKVIRKLKRQTKNRYKKRLKQLQYGYVKGIVSLEEIQMVLGSYHAHFSHGNMYLFEKHRLEQFVLVRERVLFCSLYATEIGNGNI